MLFVVLLIVANNVGRVLYANYVGQLLYVVFAPSGGVSTTDGLHRPGISLMRLLILVFIVICYFLAVYLLCGGVLLFG